MELSAEVSEFIMPVVNEVESYSHRTFSKEVAQKIINEGFKFSDSFQKTTDQIIDDIVYLRYWDSLRKHYGAYVVIIGISKKLIENTIKVIPPKSEVQQALSKITKEPDDSEDDAVFLLPREYVKGYVERETGVIVQNASYDPYFIPEKFR